MIIEINKDIDKYQESIVLGLTAKQLIYSSVSILLGGTIVLLLYKYIGLTGAAYVAVPCIAPIALQGFYTYNEMSFCEYWLKKIHFITANKALTYLSSEGGEELETYNRSVRAEQNNKKYKKLKMSGINSSADQEHINENKEAFEAMKEKTKRVALATGLGLIFAIVSAIIAKHFI